MPQPKRPAPEQPLAANRANASRSRKYRFTASTFAIVRPIPNPAAWEMKGNQITKRSHFPSQLEKSESTPSPHRTAPNRLQTAFTKRTHFLCQPKQKPATYSIRSEPICRPKPGEPNRSKVVVAGSASRFTIRAEAAPVIHQRVLAAFFSASSRLRVEPIPSRRKSRQIHLLFRHIFQIKIINSFILSMALPLHYSLPKEKSL